MIISGPPPWHLWGNTQELTLLPGGPSNPGATVLDRVNHTTMVRVSYGRPETWRFLFHLKLLSGGLEPTPDPIDPTLQQSLSASFDLIIGIGRSAVTIENFVELVYTWGFAPGQVALQGLVLWKSYTQNLPYLTTQPDFVYVNEPPIDTFVAQDITIVANTLYYSPYLGIGPMRVAVSAHIAPNVHVRPDWHNDAPLSEKFPGAEIGAR